MVGRIDENLLQRVWVHSHEEDTSNTRIFRPDTAKLPPSRGRTSYEFRQGGVVVKHAPGPDDKRATNQGTWTMDANGCIAVRMSGVPDEVLCVDSLDCFKLAIKNEPRK